MPKLTKEEREEKRLLQKQKREAKKSSREPKQQGRPKNEERTNSNHGNEKEISVTSSNILRLAEDSIINILTFLPSRELGATCMTCKTINSLLKECRVQHLLARLRNNNLHLLNDETDAKSLLQKSLIGKSTRIRTPKSQTEDGSDEYPSFARFLEEEVCGYSLQYTHIRSHPDCESSFLPAKVDGRFVSISPEHTLCRAGGGGVAGPGGSGVVSWGVGRRGQLGHGKREDEAQPRPLLGGIGYGIRIVQVSAGGGLVRVAHSLLLTDTGRVLSFGTANYGQLGHGYGSGRQLSDELRPRYVEALSRYNVTSISAGELHSAVVTSDGDVFTWGDGFCGQLGSGDKRPRLLPEQVQHGLEEECVAIVSCGNRHTLCVTEDGEVFSFGLGHFGVLGRGFTPFRYDVDDADVALDNQDFHHLDLINNITLDDPSNQCFPVRIDALEGVFVVAASAGHRHSMLLDNTGELYTFGTSSAGALGHGSTTKKMEYPMKILYFSNSDIKITQISAGVDMSMATTSSGQVYAWGNYKGAQQTRDTPLEEIPIPTLISTTTKAIDVECGYMHSVIVGVDGTLSVCGNINKAHDVPSSEHDPHETSPDEPAQVPEFNIWHRTIEPNLKPSKPKGPRTNEERKYKVKGRTQMMEEAKKWNI